MVCCVTRVAFDQVLFFLDLTQPIPLLFCCQMKNIIVTFLLLASSASAFVPPQPGFAACSRRSSVVVNMYGKYDEKEWGLPAKLDVYNSWDPNAPRSAMNFNPFETYEGNSPDASGFYPGEGRYKDPMRPDVNYALMQEERKVSVVCVSVCLCLRYRMYPPKKFFPWLDRSADLSVNVASPLCFA